MTFWTRALTNSTLISHCRGSSSQMPDWGSQNLQVFTRSWSVTGCVRGQQGRKVERLKGGRSHLKHVGHDGSSTLNVHASGAIILPDCRLAAGWGLQLTGGLRDKIQRDKSHFGVFQLSL